MVVKQLLKQYCAYSTRLNFASEDVWQMQMLMLTVGTGIGGGIVVDGKLHRGAFGVAAEIGHMRVVPEGHLCGCGARGCFEQYAS
ncbi:MAG: hypothetical protein RL585_2823, partial [Pseudomonadota bacterium]